MAEWVHVENGQIDEYCSNLPGNWRNVSGLNLSANNLSFLKQHGWLPVTKVQVNYNPVNQEINSYEYEIREDDVVETPIVVDKVSQQEESSENLELRILRQERDRRLSLTDWTQAIDIQQIRSPEWIKAWADYRQKLRDMTEIHTNFGLTEAEWPQPPSQFSH